MPTQPIAPAPPDPGGAVAAPTRGAPDTPGTPFDRVLEEQEQAWTADAGGQQEDGASDDTGSETTDTATDAATVLMALAAAPAPVATAVPVTVDVAAAPTGETPGTGPGVVTPGLPGPTEGDATPVAVAPPAGAAPAAAPVEGEVGPGDGDAAPATTAATTPDAPAESDADGVAGQRTPAGGGQPDGQTSSDAGAGEAGRRAADAARAALGPIAPAADGDAAAPAAPTAASAPVASAAASAAMPADAAPGAEAAPAPAPAPAAAVAPARPAAPPLPTTPVPLAHAPAAVADLVHVTRARGENQARLVLHPEALGGVEVRLHQTADGIRATVRVEHAEALSTLQNGLGELRRGLEARGVTVDSIDLGLANQGQQNANDRTTGERGLAPVRPGGFGREAAADETLTTQIAATARPMAGSLVDVMA